MTEEQMLREQLAALENAYRKQAEPIVRRLAAIEMIKPMRPIIVDVGSLTEGAKAALLARLSR
jgi:hypothetical protein